MKKIFLILIVLFSFSSIHAQKYKSDKSTVTFYSEAVIENIEATNNKAQSVLDVTNQNIVFSIPIDGFDFEKDLMQEHFNEKYMETEKFPKSIFSGKFSGFDINKTGKQKVAASGKLTIHGVERKISAEGIMIVEGNKIKLSSSFKVKLKDYKIAIPQLLWQNIAEEVEVELLFEYAKIN
ncbi:MAG: YceI family protein [Cyclobacteriaceae bacterium]|nr:YceI family protein [Cyclobacteriaceae bacterium]